MRSAGFYGVRAITTGAIYVCARPDHFQRARSGQPSGGCREVSGSRFERAVRKLGDYRIVRQIGQGGMGAVYEAIQESLGRRVALKILSDRGRYRPNEIERFGLEARSAARLHHGNIVPVYGFGENHGARFYAMQFIDGRGLDRILDDAQKRRSEAGHITDSGSRQGIGPSSVTLVVSPVAIEPSSDDAMDAGGDREAT